MERVSIKAGKSFEVEGLEHMSLIVGRLNIILSKPNLCSYPQEAHRYFIFRLTSELFASNSRTYFWIRFS